jgi:two-component system OmpR family response regulator
VKRANSLRVLVVDDDVEHLELVQRQLQAFGFEVRTYDSGLGVTNEVREFRPDVVLLDVNIPALSGDRLVRLLRQSQSTSRLVLFSSSDRERLRSLAREVEADDWIQKGVSPNVLADRLRQLCR